MNIPGIAALLGTALACMTGEPIYLLAWALPLMHCPNAGRVERKEDTAPPKGPIPPPVAPKQTPDRHRAAHRAWMKDISNQ